MMIMINCNIAFCSEAKALIINMLTILIKYGYDYKSDYEYDCDYRICLTLWLFDNDYE